MLNFKKISEYNYECTLNLEELYTPDELKTFNIKWNEFYISDDKNKYIFQKRDNEIIYPHKSWIPIKNNGKKTILILAGNPAPHSVWKDKYYSYEGKGKEHRFWKVFRELGFIDLNGNDPNLRSKFINLEYNSPFRIGMEAIFTFPSSASKPKWSGVMGLNNLFGKKALNKIYEIEKTRIEKLIQNFLKKDDLIIAMQKDAYNSISQNTYNIKQAREGNLKSKYHNIEIIGTPPTRWLYTNTMRNLLNDIRNEMFNPKK